MRGRKPKPLAFHVLDGTFRADRHGPRPGGPRAGSACSRPTAPRHLKGTALRIWRSTVEILERLGVLDEADQGILALYCEARAELSWADYRIRREGRIVPCSTGAGVKAHPAIGIKNAAALRAAKFASELGLTPTSRTRLRIAGPDDPDPEESDLD